jgi:Zn-dependent M28 family amino/carboxypeptidase
LIRRGDCDFGLKVAFAGGAGASGAIIYNNLDPAPSGGTLAQPSRPEGPYVPSAYITKADGEAFISRIDAGEEVVGSIHATAINEERSTSNVIATTKLGDRENIIVAGAHSDSVPAGPVRFENFPFVRVFPEACTL